MKMKSVAVLLLTSLALCARAVVPVDPDDGLRNAGSFAMGGIGVAGTMSSGERALRETLKSSDAVARLEKIATTASPAGQLYALLGLRARDRAAYQRVLENTRKTNATVETARGCILQRESFRDLVKEIESGQFDTYLSREWPERAR
jgi:hypothetical protein